MTLQSVLFRSKMRFLCQDDLKAAGPQKIAAFHVTNELLIKHWRKQELTGASRLTDAKK